MKTLQIFSIIFALVFVTSLTTAQAQTSYDDELEFAGSLEETLGHFWALEQNLDEGNAELALVHATHPVAELYDTMKPHLQATDTSLDEQVQTTLMDLGEKATTEVSRQDAQAAIDEAKEIVEIARSTIVGDGLSNDTVFKTDLMIDLLQTSIAEYGEAVSNGAIEEMAEFQDGSAFVWRSQQIFDEIKSDIDPEEAEEIEEFYADLWAAYDSKADPSEIGTITNGIIHELEETKEPRLEFASSLEETLGHFWALEQNLDEGNAELALVHATHPVAELYDAMKPILQTADPALDQQLQTTLSELGEKATLDVSRQDAQVAIDVAKDTVALARSTVVGDYLSSSVDTKLTLMKVLLETSIAEYGEAVSNGAIEEMAEFQDGSAFVWRSQQIFDEIKSDIDSHEAKEIEEFYADLWAAYDSKADPSDIETLAGGIIHEIDEIQGVESEEENLGEYVETMRELLGEAKTEYSQGNNDLALSHATKAYLDNYEFLEAPLVEVGKEDLMEEVEILLREELRTMIKEGQTMSKINSQIDLILQKLNDVAMAVAPEQVMEKDSMEDGMMEKTMSPLKQVKSGTSPQNVECESGQVLVINDHNGKPACVSPSGADTLEARGWGTRA